MVAVVAEAGEGGEDAGRSGALLRKAAGPGRVRGVGVELWAAGLAEPARAAQRWSRGLRDARMLHSAERRFVGDHLARLARWGRGLRHLLGDEPLQQWLGGLVLAGLDEGVVGGALAGLPAAWETLGGDVASALRWRHGWPDALAERLRGELGDDGVLAYARASDARAPLDLRVALRRGPREAAAAELAAEGITTEPVGRAGLRVTAGRAVTASAAFREGRVEVQDLGSQQLADLVGAEPTDVLDLCAGAGGKALALADRGHRVVAAEPRGSALEELRDRARRARVRLEAVEAAGGDAPALRGRTFGAVLVDAPCTGTGTWRRAPTLRWTWSPEQEAAHVARQGALLRQAARFVAPGGRLVYGTCSVVRAEDEAVALAFAADHPGFVAAGVWRTWPHTDGTDGFFAASFVRA